MLVKNAIVDGGYHGFVIENELTNVIELFYDDVENAYYNQCGMRVLDITSILHPNDILLFKYDPEVYDTFLHRRDKTILVIVNLEKEVY